MASIGTHSRNTSTSPKWRDRKYFTPEGWIETIHSDKIYLLSAFYLLGTVLNAENTVLDNLDKVSAFVELTF